MDTMWGDGEPTNEGLPSTAPIRGIEAPSGAVVIDADALADTFTDAMERFFSEVDPEDWEYEDLARVLVNAIERTAR